MFIYRPICWFKTLWRSFPNALFSGIPIEGCDYYEQEDGELKCETCGKIG